MIKESEQQAESREDRRAFFQTKTLRESSIGKPRAPSSPRPILQPTQGSKTVNQARGKTGKLIFKDCDDAETGRLEWKNGLITTEDEQTIKGGCEDGTSSSI